MNRALAASVTIAAACLSLSFQAPTKQLHFTDIAPRSKFAYFTNNDLSPRKYFVQPMAGGVAIFDFDNDGKMDIFLTNGAKLPALNKTSPAFYNTLLRNKGDGTFEDVTAKAGLLGENLGYNFGVAVGDFDNDGFEDLFICGAGRNTLYHNNGNGTFTDVTEKSGIGIKPARTLSVGAAWFDYDNDGLLDLVVSNYTLWSPQTDKRCSAAGVEYYCDPRLFYQAVPQRLYHNLGNGKFEDVTEKSGFGRRAGKGMGISIADFNDDGFPDVFHRQRHRAELAVYEQGQWHVRGARVAAGRGLRRQRESGVVHGQRRQGLRQRWTRGHFLQQFDGTGLGVAAESWRFISQCLGADASGQVERSIFRLECGIYRLR